MAMTESDFEKCPKCGAPCGLEFLEYPGPLYMHQEDGSDHIGFPMKCFQCGEYFHLECKPIQLHEGME